jgi:N-acetylmuramoyl-L-alanine amidase
MSNPTELSQIKKEKYVDDMARRLADGILNYLNGRK